MKPDQDQILSTLKSKALSNNWSSTTITEILRQKEVRTVLLEKLLIKYLLKKTLQCNHIKNQ